MKKEADIVLSAKSKEVILKKIAGLERKDSAPDAATSGGNRATPARQAAAQYCNVYRPHPSILSGASKAAQAEVGGSIDVQELDGPIRKPRSSKPTEVKKNPLAELGENVYTAPKTFKELLEGTPDDLVEGNAVDRLRKNQENSAQHEGGRS